MPDPGSWVFAACSLVTGLGIAFNQHQNWKYGIKKQTFDDMQKALDAFNLENLQLKNALKSTNERIMLLEAQLIERVLEERQTRQRSSEYEPPR